MGRVEPNPEVVQKLASVTLPEASGKAVRLGDLWAKKPLVLVHLRHFG